MVYCDGVARTEPQAPNFLLRWSLQAIVAGGMGAVLVRGFVVFTGTLERAVGASGVHPVVVAVGAAALVGLLIYRLAPGAAGEGVPAYLRAVRGPESDLPLRDTIMKYPAAILTLGCYGSGGAVGPIGRVTAGLSQWATRHLQRLLPRLFADSSQHHANYHAPTTAAISGMAAAVASIFGAPIAGAVFAVEVIQTDQLRYHQLFPAALAAGTAGFVSSLAGWPPPVNPDLPVFRAEVFLVLPVIVVGFFCGVMGIAYTSLYRVIARSMGRERSSRRIPAMIAGMGVSALLGAALSPTLWGTARGFYDAVLHGDFPRLSLSIAPTISSPAAILAILIVAKIVGNCITTGSGMSAGFTGPAALVGLAGGALVAVVLGIAPATPGYVVLLVAGFAGMLAATMNTPLAGAILAVELFGGGYGVAGILSAMIAFQVARFNTIYEVALETADAAPGTASDGV